MKYKSIILALMLIGGLDCYGESSVKQKKATDEPKYINPVIQDYGKVVKLPEASHQPRDDSKIVVDITKGGDPAKLNSAIEKVARFVNIYAGAGKKSATVQIAVVLHGDATLTILKNDVYSDRFNTKENPNLALISELKDVGVEFFVCGQSLIGKGAKTTEVSELAEVAVSGLSALVNLQTDGYAYLPILKTSSSPGNTEKQPPTTDVNLIQYGRMREVIGMKKSHGRIALTEAATQPHLFAVGALEGLTGEVTVLDGEVIATSMNEKKLLESVKVTPSLQATLLVGKHITEWSERTVSETVSHKAFDSYIEQSAKKQGVDTSRPFVFTVTGEFADVHLHVIHGACPLHAKIHGVELQESEKPYEGSYTRIEGTLVGVFAKDSVGVLTHPGTSTHAHLVFKNASSGTKNTAHVEQIGLKKGAVVRFPKYN